MALWHLDELRNALERRGWRFEGELPGDGYAISATCSFRRSASDLAKKWPVTLADFVGALEEKGDGG